MPPEALPSRDLARRLIAREPAGQGATDPAAAAQAACEHAYWHLSRWVGGVGSAALFRRALLTTQKEHPELAGIRIRPDTERRLAAAGDAVRTRGSSVPAAAWEALLEELIALLSRFIGADVAMRLLDRSVAETARDELGPEEQEAWP